MPRQMLRAALITLALLSLTVPTFAACKQVKAETDINGIRIGDPDSTKRVLGPLFKEDDHPKVQQDKDAAGADTSFPYLRLATRDGRQEVKLFSHYGDLVDSYNEIEVAPVAASTAARVPFDGFATERGVKLGMREPALVKHIGSCFKRERAKDGVSVIKYEITDPRHVLLKRANMPSYYAHYTFRGGALVRFAFGFEYP
jgi:hypothetical protein